MRDFIRVWLFIVLAACLYRAIDIANVYDWVLILEDASKNFNSPGATIDSMKNNVSSLNMKGTNP